MTSNLGENNKKITLADYYNSLPGCIAPKARFIEEVRSRCHVTEQTVRNWVLYGMRPNNDAHLRVLSELTGIKADELFPENRKGAVKAHHG